MSEPEAASELHALVARVFREESGRVLATMIRILGGDFDAAEEAVSDAFLAAIETWPRDGMPSNPGAWLTTTARNRALDRIRRARRQADKLAVLEHDLSVANLESIARIGSETHLMDDRLRLIFTCCHPALSLEARVALTLRTLGGLTTPEIARAFLVPEATLAQRLVRAKRKIRYAGIPYRVPPDEQLAERLDGVLATIYLIFNEGYAASEGASLVRRELCSEAIRLARIVHELMPGRLEPAGLLSLLLLQDSRRDARTAADGSIVLLGDQDRARWDRAEIEEGLELASLAWRSLTEEPGDREPGDREPDEVGPYLLQATIASHHARTVFGEPTDWVGIANLYAALARIAPSPVVELNRAVAVSRADGAAAGLRLVDALAAEGALDQYHLLYSTRADLLRQLERREEAAEAYRRALDLASNPAERIFLETRLAEVSGS